MISEEKLTPLVRSLVTQLLDIVKESSEKMPPVPTPKSDWISCQSAAKLYDFRTPRAFREWGRRHQLRAAQIGQKLFYRISEIDAALESTRPPLPPPTPPLSTREAAAERAVDKLFGAK